MSGLEGAHIPGMPAWKENPPRFSGPSLSTWVGQPTSWEAAGGELCDTSWEVDPGGSPGLGLPERKISL